MKRLLIVLFLLFNGLFVGFSQNSYSVNSIPDSLLVDADVVIRLYSVDYERTSIKNYTQKVHFVVTILNPQGQEASILKIRYDSNSKVKSFKGKILNKNGIEAGSISKKDLIDIAENEMHTLINDSRFKIYKPAVNQYPYTVEYVYEREFYATIGFDSWIPHHSFRTSVEKAMLTFRAKKEMDINFKQLNYPFKYSFSENDDFMTYFWEVENLKAIKFEKAMPMYLDVFPAVILAPQYFEYEGTTGNFLSWNNYGKWVYGLLEGRDELPSSTIETVQKLTADLPDDLSKAKVVYKYMQQKTRYVNIALGIGGFQPMKASEVDKKGYGDCKALTNYTRALLKAVGIESYYSEIGTGPYQQIKFSAFPSANQTNHVILCLPINSDTFWLECTNQKIPFGFLGVQTQGRKALIVKPEGGVLAEAKSYNTNENLQSISTKILLQPTGNATFSIIGCFQNSFYDSQFYLVHSTQIEQIKYATKNINTKSLVKINQLKIRDISDTSFLVQLSVDGEIENLCDKVGTKFIVRPIYFQDLDMNSFDVHDRTNSLFIPDNIHFIDSVSIYIPDGYKIDHIPESQHFKSLFGTFSYQVSLVNQDILIVSKMSVFKGVYTNDSFKTISDFASKVRLIKSDKILYSKTL
ncbi:MAG: DUF3857 domain-containing protein [Bacteroidales bacterium]|nr:DUF3857 domain-containing protein [Bacteroidales bacterium]